MKRSEELKITLLQSDLHWRSADANLAAFEERIWKINEATDLIILPEMFTTGFTMEPEEVAEPVNSKTYRWLSQMAKQTKAVVMGSAIIQIQGDYFNRMIVALPDGGFHTYDKTHLFTLAGEDGSFSPGSQRTIFEVKGWTIMPQICYDLRFPVWSRSKSSDEQLYEYDLLVYSANWPVPRVQAWDSLLKARAIENASYCAGVNRIGTDGYGKDYCGHSAVYDFLGNTVMDLGENERTETTTLSSRALDEYREKFPFQKDADRFSLI